MKTRFSERLAGRVALAAIAFIVALAPTSAVADPTAADIESAREMYKDGKELRAKGDLQGSLAKLRAAHTLAATPITALELGRALSLVGELVEARETWLSIERLPVLPDESSKAGSSRTEALKLVDKLTPRIASLSIKLEPPRAEDGAQPVVRIDDREVPAEALTVSRKMNPGHHTIAIVLGRARASAEVELREGEAKTVSLRLRDDAPNSPPAATVVPAVLAPEPAPPREASTSSLVYVGLGTAAVGAVVSGVTGIVALSRASTVKSECASKQCGPENHDDLDGSRAMGTVSTIALLIAGAGVAVAGIGWLTGGSSTSPASARVSVKPIVLFGGAGVRGEFW